MHQQVGQTLVESIIVVTILGILGAMAAPGLSEMLQARRAQSFASVLHAELNLARNSAIVHGYRTVLCRTDDGERCVFSGSWTRGFMSFVDVDGNRDRSPSEPVFRTTSSSDFRALRIHFSEGRRVIVFRPDGRGGGTNLTVVVCDASGTPRRTVVVSVAGRVRLGQPAHDARCP